MKKIQGLLILSILIAAGCSKNRQNIVITNNEHIFQHSDKIQDIQVAMPDSIQIGEWATDGEQILISTDNADCMFAILSLDSVEVSNTFGKKGKGAGEFLMPHVIGSRENGFMIVDNGNNKIMKVDGTSVSEVNVTGKTDMFNQPHFIGTGFIGFEELSPTRLTLNKYGIAGGETATILTFPEEGVTDNSDLFDFVWDYYDGKLVTAHLYTDKFSIRNYDADGNISSINHVGGNDNYSQDHITYSDIACGDYIYLLYQANVDIENFSGYSVIEKYDYDGTSVSKYEYDGIIDKIILDQEHNRMFFTSTSDEDIHYFEL